MKQELDAVMHSRESVEAAAQGSASSGHGTTAVGTISHLRHSRTQSLGPRLAFDHGQVALSRVE